MMIRGARKPKTYVLSGVRSSDGKRLDQEMNRNFGQELAKLQKEKNSLLNQGLEGGNNMATYKFKRFSSNTTTKSYILKRKTFNVVGDGVAGIGKMTNGLIGGVEKVGGDVGTKVGKGLKSNIGSGVVGLLAKGAIGAATGLGPLASTAIGFLGSKLAGNVVQSGSEALQDSAAKRGYA